MRFQHVLLLGTLTTVGLACGGQPEDVDQGQQALMASCAETDADVPAGAWVCGESRTVECTSASGTEVDDIYVVADDVAPNSMLCGGGDSIEVSDPGPYAPGIHDIIVTRVDAAGAATDLCTSELHVQDTLPPEITMSTPMLWPPNHKFHTLVPSDCVQVEDACDADPDVVFTWASSDEPDEGLGDGNHEPDIMDLTCDSVQLRAERSGNLDGRVYKLGIRVTDHDGNQTEGVCVVMVTHDQRGTPAVDSGEDHRIELAADACSGGNGGSGGSGSGTGTGTSDPANGGTGTGGSDGGDTGPIPPGGL